jgi:hypothetical protein
MIVFEAIMLLQLFIYLLKIWDHPCYILNILRDHELKNNFAGDCDDYAILMAALGEATGFRMRILFGCSESEYHAFPEAYLWPENDAKKLLQYLSYTFRDTIHYSKDGKGDYWLSLDWTSNHIGGKYLVNKVYIAIYPAEKRYEVLSAK